MFEIVQIWPWAASTDKLAKGNQDFAWWLLHNKELGRLIQHSGAYEGK
jgi:hypothetical protein